MDDLDLFLSQWREEIHGDSRQQQQAQQQQQQQQQPNLAPRADLNIDGGHAPYVPQGYTPHEEELLYEPLDEFPLPKRARHGNEDNKPPHKVSTPLFSINVNVAEVPEVDLSRQETEQRTPHTGDTTVVAHKGVLTSGEEGYSPEEREGNGAKDKDGSEDQSFVDTLIKDLDEINTVPFFDVELPREIALQIFSYLSLKDLCSCAQVSRSWKSLSEDNVLWSTICHRMGHHLESEVGDFPNWKKVVQQVVEKDRTVLQNWKERNCGLTEYQPHGVGILCTVDVHDNIAVVGYSDGSVFLWDLTVDSEPAMMTQPTGIYTQSKPSCSVVRGNVAAVGTIGGVLKVFNVYGLCQEHTLLSPGRQPFSHINAAILSQSPHIAASYSSGGWMVAWGSGANAEWDSRTFPPEPGGNEEIQQIFVINTQRESDPCGVIVCQSSCVRLQMVGGHLVDIIRFPERTSKVYYTSHCDTVLGRVDVRREDGLLAWGSGVRTSDAIKVYDYATGVMKHSITCKLRHAVTALNFGDSPPQMIASGNTDYRVLIHDMRSPSPLVMSLKGHDNVVTDVQMDGWKVASGSLDGTCVIWDQRMTSLLWQSNARHPVRKCHFQGDYLVTANIPKITSPELIVRDFDHLGVMYRSIPSRYLGMLRVFDFSVNPLYYTKFLPSICSSAYNEPSASDYNLDLIVPYDDIA